MDTAEIVRHLAEVAALRAEPAEEQRAARNTGGVPVYSDMGGVLVITADIRVLHFDPEQDVAHPVEDERWRTIALASAAKKFPELASLLPPTPSGAPTCHQCAGRGVLLGTIRCGQCLGLGWTAAE